MARPKHSLAKLIEPSQDQDEQFAMAFYGGLREYEAIYAAFDEVVWGRKTKGFRIAENCDPPDEVEAKNRILEFILDAIIRSKPERIHDLADLLELYLKGKPVSPLETFFVQLKINYPQWQRRKEGGSSSREEDEFWGGWPFSLTKLREYFDKSGWVTKVEGRPLNDVKNAADNVGLPYTNIKGRPKGAKARE